MSLVMKIDREIIHSWVGLKEWPTVYLTDPPLQPMLPGPSVKWKIADTSIVKQDERGYFCSLKTGETTITAISDDGQYQASSIYRVEDASNITVTGFTFYNEYGSNRSIKKYIIGYGESVVLGARSHSPIDNNLGVYYRDVEINHGGVIWSTSDPEIATVVPDDIEGAQMFWRGKVTAGNKSGTVMVRVASVTCPDVYSEFPIEVRPTVKHIKSIRINPSSLEIAIGQKQQVEAIITPSDATDQTLFWTVPIGATCSASGGLIRGVRKGGTRVTVTSQDGSISAVLNVTVTDSVVPLSKLELNTYSIQVQMDTDKETHYPSVTAYVPTKPGQDPENVGINVEIKDPEILKIREIKVLSEKSNRRSVVFKGGKPGYTTVKISSKTDPSQFSILEVMVINKISDVFLPYTIHTVPDEIEVERGQIFTLWARGFGGLHQQNVRSTDRCAYNIYNITWDGNWRFTPNCSQLEVLRLTGDTNQSYAWIRAGYIPGDYEITVTRHPGGVLQEEYGSKTVKVKIVDKIFNETIGELIPSTYYLCFMDKDTADVGDRNSGRMGNPGEFYLGWIKEASTNERATRFKDSEYDNIGWKIARDGIISKIERSGSLLKLYRGPNYGTTQVIFYLKSNPHVYYPCWVEYDGGDFRNYTTDKNISIVTSTSPSVAPKSITNTDISNGRVQTDSTTEIGTALPSSSTSSGGTVVVTETGTYRASTYNPKYNYKSDTGLPDTSTKIKNTKKISRGSFIDPNSKRGGNSSSKI